MNFFKIIFLVSKGFGTRVADLYINWAFHFDVKSEFQRAENIFRRGLTARAEPLDLLKTAHKEFGYSMSQRMLHDSDKQFQQQLQEQMKRQFEEIAALRIDGTTPNHIKSTALQMIDKCELLGICMPTIESATLQTPEKEHNLSMAKNIIDSARKIQDSTRKLRREKSRKLNTTACRLDFNENPSESPQEKNLYAKGIQLGRNFKSKNLPQTHPQPIAYSDPMIGKHRGELPAYDKIMLVPATNVAFSPDELKAYNWFKQKGIVNAFTKEHDKIWGVGYTVPIRWANVFAPKNFPQQEWNVPRISQSDEFNERAPYVFRCNLNEHYPKNSIEEFSLEEIMWRKRNAAILKTAQNTSKMSTVLKLNRTQNRTNSADQSKLSPIVEMELSGYGANALTEAPQKRRESIHPNTTGAEIYKKRKSSIFPTFDQALNDTCTTQMFSNLLHGSAISTPKAKMPKFDDDGRGGCHNWHDETKLKLFTDQSTSEQLPEVNKQVEKVDKINNQSNEMGFAIYEDKTMTLHANKNAMHKDMINDLTIGNKENIAVTENQLANLEPSKFESKKCESSVMNSMAQQSEKLRLLNGFHFDIYTDNTETIMNAVENARKLFDCDEPTNENKENVQTQLTNTKTNIEEELASVNRLIESVLNATKPDGGMNASKNITNNNNKNNDESNATKNDHELSIFKEPKLLPKKIESTKRPNETTFFDILDTTEEFEKLEAQCANSPNMMQQSFNSAPMGKLEQSFAKNVTIGTVANKTNRLSIQITEQERLYILNNPSVNDKTRFNWTQQPSMWECPEKNEQTQQQQHPLSPIRPLSPLRLSSPPPMVHIDSNDADDDTGKSIYVQEPELQFNEKDADWKEVTMFMADTTAVNEYKAEEVNLDETRHRMDTYTSSPNMRDLNPFDPELQKDVLTAIGFVDRLNGANNFNCTFMNIVQPLKPKSSIEINKRKYQIRKLIGTGAFGKVFSAECTKTKAMLAFKQQRPPNLWVSN